jgi:hypothetical protein
MVPRKAILGRANGATSLLSVSGSLVYLNIYTWVAGYWLNISYNKIFFLVVFIVIFVGNYLFNRLFFLRPSKHRSLLQKYESWKKKKLGALGAFFMIFCFAFFIASSIKYSLIKREGHHVELHQSY